jgi:hypothetical protein
MAEATSVATQEQRSVAPMGEIGLPTKEVLSVAHNDEVERIEQSVVLPPIYQYSISRYGQQPRVMVTSDGYDYLNRSMSVQLHQPEWVNDESGQKVRNPIHRADYIYLRMIGIWYNDLGQLVSYREDVEVDFKLVYHDARINSKSARVETDANGIPVLDAHGTPIVKLDAGDELKALKALSQLRTFGLRYAQTVAKTRILKTASGIKQLPIPQPRPFTIRVVGYRDRMTPDERIAKAEADLNQMYGSSVRMGDDLGIRRDEMPDLDIIEGSDATEDIERELVDAATRAQENEGFEDNGSIEGIAERVGEDEVPTDDGLGLADAPTVRRR